MRIRAREADVNAVSEPEKNAEANNKKNKKIMLGKSQ
jgi:hypothetical protein